MNPVAYLDRACAAHADDPCLVDGKSGRTLSYAEVQQRTRRIAATLRDMPGIGMVGILSPNDIDAYILQLGCYRAGVMVVPGNARYAVADNAAIFRRFGADIVFLHPDLANWREEIGAALPDARFVSPGRGAGEGLPGIEDWLGDACWDGVVIDDPETPYAIQPTGGTTGEPKGVLMPVREMRFAVESLLQLAPSERRPVFLAAVPLTHAAGKFMLYTIAQGGCGVILPGAEPAALAAALKSFGATHCFLPPTVIYGLLDSGLIAPGDLPDLEYMFYGAAPMSPARLAEAIALLGPVMAQVYGQTESGVPNCFLSRRDHLGADGLPAGEGRLGSAGRVNPMCDLALLDDKGMPVAAGEVGEIAIRCDGVMLGYHGDAGASAACSRDGWHMTGDLARMDGQGFVHIVDRAKDLIISGGFNIYPAEVERAVNAHPGVADCAVIGIPDERWGEAVAAVVERREGAQVTGEELIAACKAAIGSMKAPKSVIFIDELPRSPVGKILKKDLRQQFWATKERLV